MSCLVLDELTLSEQVAVAASWSAAVVARTAALLARLEPPAPAPAHPLSRAAGVGGSNLLHHPVEEGAMLEQQITNHPPLQVCYPGHQPHLYQATGNGATRYYVECSVCGVRSPRFATAEAAAHAWGTRNVQPIDRQVA